MAAMVIEIPEELKTLGESILAVVEEVRTAVAQAGDGRAVDYAAQERALGEAVAAIERAGHQAMLAALDVDRPRVLIEGKTYARVARCASTYRTQVGPVSVVRSLYRECGHRNAKVVDAVSLRAGVVADGWLPQTARAMAHLVQMGTSREAETTARETGRLPYSRSSFERVAHHVGELYVAAHADIEDALIAKAAVVSEARSVSVALDRVSVPMEEPIVRGRGRPKKDAPKVARNFRMAYCATVTLHDEEGKALETLRYGRMPKGDADGLCNRLTADVNALLRKRPDLKVTALSDGAAEMVDRLREHINPQTVATPVHQLVDFWHLIEKLGAAARVVYAAECVSRIVQGWKLRLLNEDHAAKALLAELKRSGCDHVRVGDSRPVHEAITYLANHLELMNYADARRKGLPIGSGNVEATCKSLFTIRFKRAGSRWKQETGEHVVQLRAVALSDRWAPALTLALSPLRQAVRPAA